MPKSGARGIEMKNVSFERADGVLFVNVTGRIDGSNSHDFAEAVANSIEDDDRALVMDLNDLTYISSAGLRAVLVTEKNLRRRGSDFVICSLSGQIQEIFRVSGFDRVIKISRNREGAMDLL